MHRVPDRSPAGRAARWLHHHATQGYAPRPRLPAARQAPAAAQLRTPSRLQGHRLGESVRCRSAGGHRQAAEQHHVPGRRLVNKPVAAFPYRARTPPVGTAEPAGRPDDRRAQVPAAAGWPRTGGTASSEPAPAPSRSSWQAASPPPRAGGCIADGGGPQRYRPPQGQPPTAGEQVPRRGAPPLGDMPARRGSSMPVASQRLAGDFAVRRQGAFSAKDQVPGAANLAASAPPSGRW